MFFEFNLHVAGELSCCFLALLFCFRAEGEYRRASFLQQVLEHSQLFSIFFCVPSHIFNRGRFDCAIKELVFGARGDCDSYTPTALLRLTRALMPDYRRGTQQDAHEYLHLLLSAWAEDYGLQPKEFMQSPAYVTFGGCYSQLCRCLTCGAESRKYSADLGLSIEVMKFVEEKVLDSLPCSCSC